MFCINNSGGNMVINKIKINGFGKLKDLDIPLKNGINIINGDNESRKIYNSYLC